MKKYYSYGETAAGMRKTPQSEPMREDQVPNAAGGYVWKIDDWARLRRFLILGSDSGTYYASGRELTKESAQLVIRLIKEDGGRVLETLRDIARRRLAAKPDAGIFTLALIFANGDTRTRQNAVSYVPAIVNTGTHLFMFCEFIDAMRGWGPTVRQAVARWYENRNLGGGGSAGSSLAYQLAKYQQRNGWSHRDVLRLAHPKPQSDGYNWLFRYAVGKEVDKESEFANEFILVCEKLKQEMPVTLAAKLIAAHNVPREAVRSELLREPVIWQALLPHMGPDALLRNLGVMTANGTLKAGNTVVGEVISRIQQEAIRGTHPIKFLIALKTYASGHGERGKLSWNAIPEIIDALDWAFYTSFGAQAGIPNPLLLAVDTSHSMTHLVNGVPNISARMVAAATAMLFKKNADNAQVIGFSNAVQHLTVSAKQRLDDILKYLATFPAQSTNCALPMEFALKEKIKVDGFMLITDNETWSGDRHPAQALRRYREQINPKAKLAVLSTTATESSILDPTDAGMLDIVGFSPDVYQLVVPFLTGKDI